MDVIYLDEFMRLHTHYAFRDYSADFTKTRPGDNRIFDLRREFMAVVDQAPIKATSILNGAFMDMLGRKMPIILPRIRRVLYWHNADQLLDFTTKDDVAAYVAAAAMDEMTAVTGARYRLLWAGSLGMRSVCGIFPAYGTKSA